MTEQFKPDDNRSTIDSRVGQSTAKTAVDRGTLIGRGGAWLATWSLRLILIAAAVWILGWVVGEFWVIILPVSLAIIVSTVLWPVTRQLRDWRVPASLAALVTIVVALGGFVGVIALIVPSVVAQVPELANQATQGIRTVQDWLQGPPLNIREEQFPEFTNAIVTRIQESSTAIASGVFTGVSAATSVIITLALTAVLTFFFIKDGPRFLPWLNRSTGSPGARHVEEVLRRQWRTLSGFIRTQAIVSFVDALFIGIGLVVLGVPLAGALAVITFIAGFVPIVGAFVAGALAVLVALVANGPTTALVLLGIIILVQQLESNVLQPVLQSKSMNLHPVVVLLSVTAGGTLFGVIGAFLAVPVAAVVAVAVRYIDEVISERCGEAPGSVAIDQTGDGDASVGSRQEPDTGAEGGLPDGVPSTVAAPKL
ncbi:AI-2E family transporter [Hoyosella subflava]|uniref:Integral membrane protein n=1 Tax=Hoyosella subflava (strain DSM 45089 / JCM 17490 / NBRC 109087 / DQS3-9A1) TaxID=443218 RepID=F6EQ13_HOYSD|nr:Integral membrane protein [Hoyosella subflava DQS3-9A1]